ncbi:MAG: hypothetical protein EBT08_21145, partial [Betaproteobacteria bacterium]|nr:hypothetical protein [Betaproteobacteria bacterium]
MAGGFSLSTLGIAVGGLALAAGGGGGGGSSNPGLGGQAVDGYLAGSTVTRVNGSGNSVVTDKDGRFTGLTGTGAIKVVGGTDASTGQKFTGTLTAPEGATVVTPITTLVNELAKSGISIEAARASVLAKLGLSASFDLLNADPIALANTGNAQALAVFKAGAMVATALQVIAGGDPAQFASAANALAKMLDAAPANGQTGANLLISVLDDVVVSVKATTSVADLAFLNQSLAEIDQSTAVSDVAGSQASVLTQALNLQSTGSAITFTVTADVSAKTVSFGGNATGAVTINIGADGTAGFSRAGQTASTTVANFSDQSGFYNVNIAP